MYKNEIKNELQTIYNSNVKIDEELVKIKIVIHNLDKLGLNTSEFERLLDNLGIEFYKLKEFSKKIYERVYIINIWWYNKNIKSEDATKKNVVSP